MPVILHGYWRSTASYRVRIALNVKGVAYKQATHDLRTGAQRDPAFLALAPQGLVPAVDSDDGALTQSLAILEWIEERWPEPSLLPEHVRARAIARAMAGLIAADIHPLNNLRVLEALRENFSATPNQVHAWIDRWTTDGFSALERMISAHGGRFGFGDSPSLADCVIVAQVYSAERFGVDLTPFAHLRSVAANAMALEPFAAAHPRRQHDADAP